MKLLALCGSLRAASLNKATLQAMAELAGPGVEFRHAIDLGELPLFNPDADIHAHASVTQLLTQIMDADALVIASPEYAHGVSGVMKNALDWMVGTEALVNKPVAVINISPRAHLAHAALYETLSVMSSRVIDEACITLPVMGHSRNAADIVATRSLRRALQAVLEAISTAVATPAPAFTPAPSLSRPFLFEASVPVFSRYLNQLSTLIQIAEAHAQRHALAEAEILQARLSPDMLPLALQIEIAANFVKRACAPLAGLDIPGYESRCESFAELQQHIETTRIFVATLSPEQMATAASRTHESKAGEALVTLKGTEFLTQYALPNFFFHLTTAYAILRHIGIAVGKADFDGFHQYPRPQTSGQ